MRKDSTASKISELVNSTLFNPIQVGVELTTEHRYLINEFFKATLHFMGQLKRDYEQGKFDGRDEFACKCASKMVDALAAAGIVGNLIKTNASISGAECGCQAEIGSACSMAAAAIAELYGMSLEQQEYAAEVAMEHHLGLTCDPIAGLVQIPCIERNAVAAMRALNSAEIAKFLFGSRKISFDLVVETMYETGRDMSGRYRETSEGGLAKLYQRKN